MAVAIAIAIVSLVITTVTAKAAVIASDARSNYAQGDGTSISNLNAGSGFQAWAVSGTATATLEASGFQMTVPTDSSAIFLAERDLVSGFLPIGGTFSTTFSSTSVEATGNESVAVDFFVGSFQVMSVFTTRL